MSSRPTAPRLITGLHEIADRYDVVFSDVWGVVHDGRRAFTEPCRALARFREGGGTVILLTNAPRPNGPIRAQLADLGVPRDAYDDIVTSGDSTVALIAERGEEPVFHIGPDRCLALLDAVRAKTGRAPALAPLDEAAHVVCSGLFDDAVETPDHYEATYAAMRRRGLVMICANPDIVVHVGDRLMYCAGALAERYAALGGTVLYAGKPHAPIYDLALRIAAEHRGGALDAGRVLTIGDGMHTDVAGAAARGLDCLFVANGIHRAETMRAEGGIDPDGLARFLAEKGAAPVASIDGLRW